MRSEVHSVTAPVHADLGADRKRNCRAEPGGAQSLNHTLRDIPALSTEDVSFVRIWLPISLEKRLAPPYCSREPGVSGNSCCLGGSSR
jgi:hypothetical protein